MPGPRTGCSPTSPPTFVELADTLVDDFDVIDFLLTLAGRCVRLLDVDAAGIMLEGLEVLSRF